PVAGVGEVVIEPTNLAARPQGQEALEQPAHAAARTTATKPLRDRQPSFGHSCYSQKAKRRHAARRPLATNARRRRLFRVRHPCTPNIAAEEQKQPHHVDEVPVPRRELEAEMLRG